MPKGTRRAPDRGADEEIALRVASYRPRAVEEPVWAAIRPFVLSCATALPLAGWASATRALHVLVQITLWAMGEGMALDRELVSDPIPSSASSPHRLARMLREQPTEQFFVALDHC